MACRPSGARGRDDAAPPGAPGGPGAGPLGCTGRSAPGGALRPNHGRGAIPSCGVGQARKRASSSARPSLGARALVKRVSALASIVFGRTTILRWYKRVLNEERGGCCPPRPGSARSGGWSSEGRRGTRSGLERQQHQGKMRACSLLICACRVLVIGARPSLGDAGLVKRASALANPRKPSKA